MQLLVAAANLASKEVSAGTSESNGVVLSALTFDGLLIECVAVVVDCTVEVVIQRHEE